MNLSLKINYDNGFHVNLEKGWQVNHSETRSKLVRSVNWSEAYILNTLTETLLTNVYNTARPLYL